jgi:hypothetical protein
MTLYQRTGLSPAQIDNIKEKMSKEQIHSAVESLREVYASRAGINAQDVQIDIQINAFILTPHGRKILLDDNDE